MSYRVHWRDPVGAERSRTFRLARAAEAFARSVEVEKDRGTYRDPSAGREQLGPYLTRFLASAHDLRPATVTLYRSVAERYVLAALGASPLASISPADVRGFVARLVEGGTGTWTIQVAHQVLSRVLRQAVADGLITSNPAHYVRPPRGQRRPIRILTAEEVESLADAIDGCYRVMVLLGAYGGLRFGEAAALRRGRVRMLERRLEVAEGLVEVQGRLSVGPLKSSESRRTITLPAFLVEELAAHMAAFMRPPVEDPSGTDPLFTSPGGGFIRRTNWRRRVWGPAARAAGIDPEPTFHHLRHAAAALAIAQGAHPKAIQARLGHASITTTLNTYGGLFASLDEDLAVGLDAARMRAAERLRNDRGPSVLTPMAQGN